MTKPPAHDTMTPKRRELYFRVINDLHPHQPITHRLHFLDDHFPLKHLDTALTWLVQNNITGANFVRWFEHSCKNSDLEMHRILVAIVSNSALAPVINDGRNFRG